MWHRGNAKRRRTESKIIEDGEGTATGAESRSRCDPNAGSAGSPLLGSRWFPRFQIRLLRPPSRTFSLPLSFLLFLCLFGCQENVALLLFPHVFFASSFTLPWFLSFLLISQAREEMSRERLRYLEAMVTLLTISLFFFKRKRETIIVVKFLLFSHLVLVLGTWCFLHFVVL